MGPISLFNLIYSCTTVFQIRTNIRLFNVLMQRKTACVM
uniref:Uncharacterized protein n=1 Tax=Anguilla anguilla TaxID=7936 RepID=A0A0E9Q4T3_ANGAN